MTTLAETISKFSPDGIACITPTERVTWSDLLSDANKLRFTGEVLADPIVNGFEIVSALKRMIALDGFASALYLVPEDMDEELRAKVRELADGVTKLPLGASTHWVIATSGTSGAPKLVVHDFRSLTNNLKIDINIGGELRWGLLYDPCRFAGLQVILQSCVGGSSLLWTPSGGMDECLDFLSKNFCTSVSATPSMWRKILSCADASQLRLRHITLGGEIADDKTLERLRLIFPKAKIAHIYASTEAGVGFSVRDGKAGFPLAYLTSPPVENLDLAIAPCGTLKIRSKSGAVGYIEKSQVMADSEGFITTGDLVNVKGRRVFFLGRANGSINVGGQKVMPEEVETILRSCLGVTDALVYGKASPVLGSIVVADVVVENGSDGTEVVRQLHSLCQVHLDKFKRPAIIRVVSDIKLTGAGKVGRRSECT